jgi:hypothetical protein
MDASKIDVDAMRRAVFNIVEDALDELADNVLASGEYNGFSSYQMCDCEAAIAAALVPVRDALERESAR